MKVYFEYGETGYSKILLFIFNDEFIQRHLLQPILNPTTQQVTQNIINPGADTNVRKETSGNNSFESPSRQSTALHLC
jgi:hypothetical protein